MNRRLVFIAAMVLAAPFSLGSAAQEFSGKELSEKDPSQMSREEWRAHVKAARERAVIARREYRYETPRLPTMEEIAEEASRRTLEDDSLRSGDIVSTNRGMYRYQGRPDRERNPDDFVRVR